MDGFTECLIHFNAQIICKPIHAPVNLTSKTLGIKAAERYTAQTPATASTCGRRRIYEAIVRSLKRVRSAQFIARHDSKGKLTISEYSKLSTSEKSTSESEPWTK